MNDYLQYIFDDFFYSIIDAIAVAISIGVFIRLVVLISPLRGWEKVKENSIALAIIWSVVLFIFGAFVIAGFFIP